MLQQNLRMRNVNKPMNEELIETIVRTVRDETLTFELYRKVDDFEYNNFKLKFFTDDISSELNFSIKDDLYKDLPEINHETIADLLINECIKDYERAKQ